MITPTIGRKVWYYDYTNLGALDPYQAFDASVIYVWGVNSVTLDVTDHHGNRHIKQAVALRDPQPGDCHGSGSEFATWMPYQVGQARKEG